MKIKTKVIFAPNPANPVFWDLFKGGIYIQIQKGKYSRVDSNWMRRHYFKPIYMGKMERVSCETGKTHPIAIVWAVGVNRRMGLVPNPIFFCVDPLMFTKRRFFTRGPWIEVWSHHFLYTEWQNNEKSFFGRLYTAISEVLNSWLDEAQQENK